MPRTTHPERRAHGSERRAHGSSPHSQPDFPGTPRKEGYSNPQNPLQVQERVEYSVRTDHLAQVLIARTVIAIITLRFTGEIEATNAVINNR